MESRYYNHVNMHPPNRSLQGHTAAPYPAEDTADIDTSAPIYESHPVEQSNDGAIDTDRNVELFSPSAKRYYEVYKRTISDFSKFTPSVQLRWCETLLEYAFNEEFIKQYNINCEKLQRELNAEECLKNRKIILGHAFKVLNKLIGLRYADAIFLMGTLYSHQPYIAALNKHKKQIVSKDDAKAFKMYRIAASLGNGESCYRAGICSECGIGCEKNVNEGIRFYKYGADECDNGSCMYRLGMIFYYDRGMVDKGMNFFQRATAKKLPQAMYELAQKYELDGEFEKSFKNYYLSGYEYGYALSQYKLGEIYENGELGHRIDLMKSLIWYYRSAENGNYHAMFKVSGYYFTGIPRVLNYNLKESINWLLKSRDCCKLKNDEDFRIKIDYIISNLQKI